jgi:hypothetical protein
VAVVDSALEHAIYTGKEVKHEDVQGKLDEAIVELADYLQDLRYDGHLRGRAKVMLISTQLELPAPWITFYMIYKLRCLRLAYWMESAGIALSPWANLRRSGPDYVLVTFC